MKLKHFLFVAVLFSMSFAKLQAQNDVNNAQAVFIYNFLSHVKWPDAEISEKYVVGIYGKTSTLGYLKSYTMNRKVGNKPIEVISLTNPDDAKKCNVVFIARSKSEEISKINEITANRSCLTISEKSSTSESGAVVDFHITGDKLRYKLDEQSARKQNLFISKALITMSL